MDLSGIADGIQQAFTDFKGGWFIACSTVIYIIIQILRGKLGFNIPWVTAKFEALPGGLKSCILLVLFAIAGGLVTLNAGFNIWVFLSGAVTGISTGLAAMGTHQVIKQNIQTVKDLKAGKADIQ
jgi:hypothetical protein